MDYNEAFKKLEAGEISECIDFFRENDYELEYAYSLLLSGRLDEAKNIVDGKDSVRYDWLSKLITLCKGEKEYPTYFQLRSFLEIDITLLIKAKKFDYVNNVLKQAKNFQGINNESYKFFGRCLLKNGYLNEAKIFLDLSLNAYYNDVELHYLIVEYYMMSGETDKAKTALENCLKINPQYYPAKSTYEKLLAMQ